MAAIESTAVPARSMPVPERSAGFDSLDGTLRISRCHFGQVARFITDELGIRMPDSKLSMLKSRLQRRVRDLGLLSIDDYCQHFFSSAGSETERIEFINAVTTNKTDFFREPQHFTVLTETVLPEMQRSGLAAPDKSIAIWSAACSSGEEPYTLAMVLSEYAVSKPRFDFRILATDVSTKVLQIAKDGIYHKQQIAPIPVNLRRKYLLNARSEGRPLLRINAALRQKVSFHHLNFMDADYSVRDMFDVIFCRNVLIYFDRPTQEAVINKLCRNLNPGGYLFISHSESLSGLTVPLVSLGLSCYRTPAL